MPPRKKHKPKKKTQFNKRSHWTPVLASVLTLGNFVLIFSDALAKEAITMQDVGLHSVIFFMAFLLFMSNRSDFKDVLDIFLDHIPFLRR